MLKTRRQEAAKEERILGKHAGWSKLIRDTPSTGSIPSQLQGDVPLCARQCLTTYINQGWQCPANDAACLCRHYSSQGYTVGELAYICIFNDCASRSSSLEAIAYNMCTSYSQFAKPTHTPLTTPPKPTSKVSSSSTTSKTTAGGHTSEATSTQPTNAVTTSSITHQSHTNAAAMSTSAYISASPVPITQQPPSTSLSNAEATGISIAAFGAIMAIGAIIYLILWIRRRRIKTVDERKSYDFVDEAPPRFSPFNYGYADPRGPLGGFEKRRAELGEDKHMTRWPGMRMSYDNYVARLGDKSISITPPEKRRSDDSARDVKWQMLSKPSKVFETPTKPQPALSRGLPKSPAPSAYTTETLFEEQVQRPPLPVVSSVPPRKPLPTVPTPGTAIYYPPPPRAESQKQRPTPKGLGSPARAPQPALSLAIPPQAARPPVSMPSLPSFPLPPPPPRNMTKTTTHIPPIGVVSTSHRDSNTSVLEYYISPHAGYETSPNIDLPIPVQVEARERKGHSHTKPGIRPPYIPKPTRMNSVGSDTSFESVGEDEPTPPEEEEGKQLSPVQESPFAGIRYPKVPRSSNQAVPRSPKPPPSPRTRALPPAANGRAALPSGAPQHTDGGRPPPPVTPERKNTGSSTLSGTTLAAKRRGDNAAHDLERRFFVADSAHSRVGSQAGSNGQEATVNNQIELDIGKSLFNNNAQQVKDSPLKGYGRVTSGGVGRLRPSAPAQSGLGLDMKNSGESNNQAQTQGLRYPGLPANPKPIGTVPVNRNSPYWEPKLTPSRRGADLYLSVGVATPQTDRFAKV